MQPCLALHFEENRYKVGKGRLRTRNALNLKLAYIGLQHKDKPGRPPIGIILVASQHYSSIRQQTTAWRRN